MSALFAPLRLREVTLRNRIAVSPMCQYSAREGLPNEWHLVHLGSRAVGGAGLVIAEASAVSPEGRISPEDTGLWSDAHAEAWAPIARFVAEQGACPAIQLAHAGRKAATEAPWRGGRPVENGGRGWTPVAPSPLPFAEGYPVPRALTDRRHPRRRRRLPRRRAAGRAGRFRGGRDPHGARLPPPPVPLAAQQPPDGRVRRDRSRTGCASRSTWRARCGRPSRWSGRSSRASPPPTGWRAAGTSSSPIVLARELREAGVDLVDCSSGGTVPDAKVPVAARLPGAVRRGHPRAAGVATGAVGLITEPAQAEAIVASGQADLVLLAREMLRDPYWPLHAAQTLGEVLPWPEPYLRARPPRA